MPQPIRLLHLSDIHFRADTAWDQEPIPRHLAKFIAGEVADGLVPDCVVITGDLAYSGKADEYMAARAWLEQALWPALSPELAAALPRDRLLLVPGNHDVDRARVGGGVRRIQDGLLIDQSQEAIAELLRDQDERELVLKRHIAYLTCLPGAGRRLRLRAQPFSQCLALDRTLARPATGSGAVPQMDRRRLGNRSQPAWLSARRGRVSP
jgi:hypothetical protein